VNNAERGGQLDPQSLAAQSVGVLIGSPLFVAGKLPWSFGCITLMHSREPRYEDTPEWSRDAVEQALRDDEPDRLLRAVIAVAMHDTDWRFAQDLCIRLSSHQNGNVRGNAVLGFGHIARIHRQLDCDSVQPIIKAALRDADGYIRGHGTDAADDTAQFLGWKYDELSHRE
jgi:hypothetical protein